MITVQRPMAFGKVPSPRDQITIPVQTFWTLIAWHHLSHELQPLPLCAYDARAENIVDAVLLAKSSSGDSSLCWAADRLLLDILVDECGCERELFSNILNTYYKFKFRRMLSVHPAFQQYGGLEFDGLCLSAYEGVVYGNPPFDGRFAGRDTINRTLDNAELASTSKSGFRGVFFLPLSKRKLSKRLLHPRVKLLMRFPNNSIPFIPESYWFLLVWRP